MRRETGASGSGVRGQDPRFWIRSAWRGAAAICRWILLASLLLAVSNAEAEAPPNSTPKVPDAQSEAPPETPVPLLLDRPSAPRASTKDWIQLKSGEWLRGAVKRMRDGSLDFDSDELDDLEIDWKDIIEVRSPILHTYVFERDRNGFSITGPARIDKTTVFVRLGDEIVEYPRSELVAILRGESRRDYWSGSISLGLTLRTGNTDQVEMSSFGWIRRETDRTRVRLDYNGSFGALSGETNTNTHRVLTSFDYFMTRKLYLTPLRFELFTDEFQNVAYRLTPSFGIGYKLMRRGSLEWDIDFGGGYQYTKFDSVQSGAATSQSGGALVFGTRFETDITKRTDVQLNYKLNLGIGDAQTSHHAEFVFSVDIYKEIDLDVNLTWDRLEDPPADSDGNFPENNDARLVVALGIEF